MRERKILLKVFVGFLMIINLEAFAQSTAITGTVKDDTNQPIPFAIITLDSTQKTTSNVQGEFKFEPVKAGPHQVRVQSMGFITQVQGVVVTNKPVKLNFSLQEDVNELETVVIDVKTKSEVVSEQSYNVTVIDTKETANQSSDINKVLSTSPGVRIREEGGVGSRFDFSLNGFNGNQVRFFLDGIPMENFGSSLTLNNIPVNVADRIEIYKGVVPVWLGSDALGGAVNIVTNQSNKNYLDLSYSYGSFNTHRTSINAAYTHPKTGLTFKTNLFQNYSDNDYWVRVDKQEGTRILSEQVRQRRFHDGYDSKTAIIDVGFINKKFADQLLVGMVLSGNNKEIQTGATMEKVYGQRHQKSTTVMPTLKYKKTDLFIKGLSVNAYASYNLGYTQSIDTASRTYYWDGSYKEKADDTDGELSKTLYKFKDNLALLSTNVSYELSKKHSFVLNYTLNSFNRKGFDEANPLNTSNQEPKLLNKSVIGLGYKFDWKDRFSASIFTKQYFLNGATYYTENIYTDRTRRKRSLSKGYTGIGTALSYRLLKNLQIKASYEHTYRLPEGIELFGDGANLRENSQLNAEESQNYNLGLLHQFTLKKNHDFIGEVSYLFRNANNFIRAAVADPTSIYTNEPAVQASGVEGSVKYTYKTRLRISANGTYQVLKNMNQYNEYGNVNHTYLSQVPNIPYLFANTNASLHFQNVKYKDDHLSIGYSANFVEEYFLKWAIYGAANNKLTIPRQISHDLNIGYSLKKGTYNISLECRNVLDAPLFDNFLLQKPGRAFYIKLRYFIRKY